MYITDHSPLKLDGYSSEKSLLILLRQSSEMKVISFIHSVNNDSRTADCGCSLDFNKTAFGSGLWALYKGVSPMLGSQRVRQTHLLAAGSIGFSGDDCT